VLREEVGAVVGVLVRVVDARRQREEGEEPDRVDGETEGVACAEGCRRARAVDDDHQQELAGTTRRDERTEDGRPARAVGRGGGSGRRHRGRRGEATGAAQ
jgi:hypothetical protein